MAKVRSPRHSRVKGANGEREFRNVIRDFGFEAERDGQTRVARWAGEPNLDVRHDIPGVHFEVKRQETYLIDKWVAQSEADAAREGTESVVAFRKSKNPWRCIVNARWLLSLLKENRDLKRRVEELENPTFTVTPLKPRHTVPGHLVRAALARAGASSVSTAETWAATHGITVSAVVAIQRGKRANVAFDLADDIAVALGISPGVWSDEWAPWYYPPGDGEPVAFVKLRGGTVSAGDRVAIDDQEGTFLWRLPNGDAMVDFGGPTAMQVAYDDLVRMGPRTGTVAA